MFRHKTISIMAILLLVIISIFMFTYTGSKLDYVLPRRAYKVGAMILISCCVAYSSIVFQTIAANRILTPSIMGFDSFFLLIQAFLVLMYGDQTFQVLSGEWNFVLSVVLMLGFALGLYFLVFKRESKSVYLLLLVGLLLGTLFRSISSFITVILNPNEFLILQGAMFASFDKINTKLLGISAVILIATLIYGSRFFMQLNVLSLGRENALSLGVNYNRVVRQNLMIISVLVAISTALVGPITFLGILVANVTYQLVQTNDHKTLIFACCLLTSITVIGGQYLVEHVFNMSTTVSIIINFIGGIYFIYLLLKTSKL